MTASHEFFPPSTAEVSPEDIIKCPDPHIVIYNITCAATDGEGIVLQPFEVYNLLPPTYLNGDWLRTPPLHSMVTVAFDRLKQSGLTQLQYRRERVIPPTQQRIEEEIEALLQAGNIPLIDVPRNTTIGPVRLPLMITGMLYKDPDLQAKGETTFSFFDPITGDSDQANIGELGLLQGFRLSEQIGIIGL